MTFLRSAQDSFEGSFELVAVTDLRNKSFARPKSDCSGT